MYEDREVCALVTLGEAQLVVGECVEPMFVGVPVEWATGHVEKFCVVGVVPLEAASAPERYRSRSHEFGDAEHVCNSAFGSLVKVTAHEVDVK